MANRILIGNRATGGHGIYVSQSGENVLTTSNALQFDSRMGASLIVHSFAQGTITAAQVNTNITHSLGYNPLFAVRWNTANEIAGGVATKVYTPAESSGEFIEMEDGGEEVESDGDLNFGMTVRHLNTNTIQIENVFIAGGDLDTISEPTLYYAIVIFHQQDFTGGLGL
jgi:hypothetical protein